MDDYSPLHSGGGSPSSSSPDRKPGGPFQTSESLPLSSSSSARKYCGLLQRWNLLLPSKRNYFLFCANYSVVHAAVDAVLAFSAAELGTGLGSLGGFVLYIFYTVSALVLAKPSVQILESRKSVFIGLLSLLIYVSGFFLAILFPTFQSVFFITGSAIGGIGAGILWTGQGTYFSLNASSYAQESQMPRSEAITLFAGIFAAFYLSFETGFKFIGTAVFLADGSKSGGSWRPAVFGIYTASAFVSTILFWIVTREYHDEVAIPSSSSSSSSTTTTTATAGSATAVGTAASSPLDFPLESPAATTRHSLQQVEVRLISDPQHDPSSKALRRLSLRSIYQDSLSVAWAIFTIRKLQLLIPFQVCFGLSAGLVDTYVNGVIVKTYIGEGYIGLLAGLVTLTAAILSGPYVTIGNRWNGRGKAAIMVFGGVCFAMGGLMLVILTDKQIASWPVVIIYYLLHGAARAVFESTNKAIVAEYFPHNEVREVAFATVYFSSGLAGAAGFAFFQFLNKYSIAFINLAVSVAAIFAFLSAKALHESEAHWQIATVSRLVALRSDSEITEGKANSDGSGDENDEMLKSSATAYNRI